MGVVVRAQPVRGEPHIHANANGELATTSPPFYNEPYQSLGPALADASPMHVLGASPMQDQAQYSEFMTSSSSINRVTIVVERRYAIQH